MLLSDDFVERPRAHARRERLRGSRRSEKGCFLLAASASRWSSEWFRHQQLIDAGTARNSNTAETAETALNGMTPKELPITPKLRNDIFLDWNFRKAPFRCEKQIVVL
jgi:hypothetical protein